MTHTEPGKERPGVIQIASTSWRSAFEAAGRMPRLFASGLLALIALGAAKLWILPALPMERFPMVGSLGEDFLAACCYAPVSVAIHRYLLLNETTDGIISLQHGYTRRFILWTMAFALLTVPLLFLPDDGVRANTATMLYVILTFVISLFTLLLFAGVGIDAPGDPLRVSLQKTPPHLLRMAITSILIMLPFLPLLALPMFVAGALEQNKAALAMLGYLVAMPLFQMFTISVSASMAALFYEDIVGDPKGARVAN